ncbi:hypothetical protein ACSXPX_003577 [Escherichia coli]
MLTVKSNRKISGKPEGFRGGAMLRGLYPWWHWLLERENPRTLQVCT